MTTETMTREETRLAQAMAAYGIGPEHVAGSRVYPDEPTRLHPLSDPVCGVVLVLKGSNKKVHWTPDAGALASLTAADRDEWISCGCAEGVHDFRFYSSDWPRQLGDRRAEVQELVGTLCPRGIRRRARRGEDAAVKANSRVERVIHDLKRAKNAAPPPQSPAAPQPLARRLGSRLARALRNVKEEPFSFEGV